jgi:hypothetical protein
MRGEMLRLTELVRDLQEELPACGHAALDGLIQGAAESVPGAQYAGISVTVGGRRLETPSATGRYPVVLDEIQNSAREGPCVADAWQHHIVRIDDLAADARWPRYGREAVQRTPIHSVLSFRLFAERRNAGALNLYADDRNAFTEDSLEVGLAFAIHVGLAWNILRRDGQFRSALASRDLIGQAKGILMERFSIDAVAAFDLLTRFSQQSNTPLAEVARRLVLAEHPSREPAAPRPNRTSAARDTRGKDHGAEQLCEFATPVGG